MRGADQNFVFIIGAARSGTRFLRDVLAASSHAVAIPFDVNYVWRYGREMSADDLIPVDAVSEAARRQIANTLMSLAGVRRGLRSRLLIEKTVSNVFRVPYVSGLFPEAKFVHLVRDGRDVAESAARMWAAPPDLRYLLGKLGRLPVRNVGYALWYLLNAVRARPATSSRGGVWGPRYPGMELDARTLPLIEVAARQWTESVEAARRGLAQVPPGQQITIRYEDLVENPRPLELVLELIGLPDPENVLAAYRSTVRADQRGKWKRLSVDEQDRVLEIQAGTLRQFGYLSAGSQAT